MTYSFLKNFGHEFCWITLRAVLIIGRVYEKTCCPAALVFLSLVVSGNSQAPNTARAKHYALYAPRPEYPLAARKQHLTGAGVFVCNLDADGTVGSVDVLRSTGHQMLDQAAIAAFRQWRFHPGDMKAIKIPIFFGMNGSGVRHRMSGAVISD